MRALLFLPFFIFLFFGYSLALEISLYPGQCYEDDKVLICLPKDANANLTFTVNIKYQIKEKEVIYREYPYVPEELNKTFEIYREAMSGFTKELKKLYNIVDTQNKTIKELEQIINNYSLEISKLEEENEKLKASNEELLSAYLNATKESEEKDELITKIIIICLTIIAISTALNVYLYLRKSKISSVPS